MKIGNKNFDFTNHQAYIMGILNVTPDSFSDGGEFNSIDKALKHVEEMVNDGADIIDIGGESTRPGHTQISVEEEISRVVPVIEAIRQRFDIPLSLDCYRHETLQAGIEAGIHLANDIWGLKYDNEMARVIADANIPVCMMHNHQNSEYENFVEDVIDDLKESISIATTAGVKEDKIIIDPGLGFGKSYHKDLYLLKNIDALSTLPYPILLGTSRKRMIKNTVGSDRTDRDIATAATTVFGYQKGCHIFRVHDVRTNRIALDMAMAIQKAELDG